MRGTIEHFDPGQRAGYIVGEDGAQYSFREMDLPQIYSLPKGTPVEFTPLGSAATGINPLQGVVQPGFAGPNGSGQAALPGAPPNYPAHVATRGLFENFKLCMTERYARFSGRAGRREYWSFVLFYMLIGVAATIVAGLLDGAFGFANADIPVFVSGVGIMLFFVFLVPGLAVLVRRVHDHGWTGWLLLLYFVPIAGFIFLLVVVFKGTQPQANQYGPGPE